MALEKKQECPKGAPAWMVSWSDMTTLLLTFFITMMSFAEIDGTDFYLVLSSFKGSLGIMTGGMTLSKGQLEEMGQTVMKLPSASQGRALSQQLKKAISLFRPEIEAKKVRVTEDERGLIITLSGDSYFDRGSALIKDELRPVLKKVADLVNVLPNFVRIEGHTDDSAVTDISREKGFVTNWELSAARSVNVVRYLNEVGKVDPKKLSSVAFAEQRPIDDNTTPEGRAYNRRVDIVILRDKELIQTKHNKIERPLPKEEWR